MKVSSALATAASLVALALVYFGHIGEPSGSEILLGLAVAVLLLASLFWRNRETIESEKADVFRANQTSANRFTTSVWFRVCVLIGIALSSLVFGIWFG